MRLKTLLVLALLITPAILRADEPSLLPEASNTLSVTDILKKIPDLKQGVAYNVEDSKFEYITTVGLIKYNDFGLSAGYSTDDKIVATLDYNIGGLQKLGIDTPITNWIDISVGVYAGYGRVTGSNEFTWGPKVTILNVKF